MATQGFLPPPQEAGGDTPFHFRQHLRQIASAVRVTMQGGLNVVGTITLAANVTTTTLTHPSLAHGSVVLLMPMTANAAAALATTYILSSSVNAKTWTITHANAATTDRTFRYAILG